MALKNSQYDEIMREYNRRQLHNKHLQDEHIAEAYQQIPRLTEIDQEITRLSMRKARSLLEGNAENWSLPEAIQALSEERLTLLSMHDYPRDYLEMHYDCPICCDTGYVDQQKCICFKKAAVDLLYTQSNIRDILKTHNFDHFDFRYYSDDIKSGTTGLSALETAKTAVRKAKEFIEHFDDAFDNLFLYGDTGVGKTFLSHCIAKELIDSAHNVIYFSAFDLFDILAKNTFSRKEDATELNKHILSCDLLIIDDLGTELTNSFVASQLFLCINERLMRRRATIISTNLSLENFAQTYSERIFSRISSNYSMLKLIGNDIRIQKKLLGGKH